MTKSVADTTSKRFGLELTLPAFDGARRVLEPETAPASVATDVVDEQIAALQAQIKQLSAQLHTAEIQNSDLQPQNDDLSKNFEQNLQAEIAALAVPVPASTVSPEVAGAATSEASPAETKFEQSNEKQAIDQDKISEKNQEELLVAAGEPDFTATVQNWTDNPFNDDFVVYDGQAQAPVAPPAPAIPTPEPESQPLVKAPASVLVSKPLREAGVGSDGDFGMFALGETPDTPYSELEAATPPEPVAAPTPAEEFSTAPIPEALAPEEPSAPEETLEQRPDDAPVVDVAAVETAEVVSAGSEEDAEAETRDEDATDTKTQAAPTRSRGWWWILLAIVVIAAVAAWCGLGQLSQPQLSPQPEAAPPVATPAPVATYDESLAGLARADAYTLRYELTDNDLTNSVILQYATGNALVQDQTGGRAYLLKDGIIYELDAARTTAQELTLPASAYERYLVLTPADVGVLRQTGSETVRGTLYRTEVYDGVTAFFTQDGLRLLRRASDGAEFAVRALTPGVESGFDVLPGVTQADREASSAAVSSLQLETLAIDLPDNNVVGEIGVGQYLVFD